MRYAPHFVKCTLALMVPALLSGCTGLQRIPDVSAHIDRTQEDTLHLTVYAAPAWLPGDPVSGRVLENMLRREFDTRSVRLDDIYYVPVTPAVLAWARLQVTSFRNESAEQIRSFLQERYGADPGTRHYERYLQEAQDCTDFSRQAMLCRWVIGIRYGIQRATVAVGEIDVIQAHAWGGIRASYDSMIGHRLNWALLEMPSGHTLAVFEPMTAAITPASEYRNPVLRAFGALPETARPITTEAIAWLQ